ncbi:MAG: DUF134 domain-containing protein [Candidatus Woesearchaeota archaeon]
MVRPRKIKFVNFKPEVTYFKPRAVPLSKLEEVEITMDELETMRLSNIEKINQLEAAEKMNIHQSTFQRTLIRAREKITDALINGKAIKIHGGEYKMPGRDKIGLNFSKEEYVFKRGFQNGAQEGICVCPKCVYEEIHIRGLPCNQKKCPNCGTQMIRKINT